MAFKIKMFGIETLPTANKTKFVLKRPKESEMKLSRRLKYSINHVVSAQCGNKLNFTRDVFKMCLQALKSCVSHDSFIHRPFILIILINMTIHLHIPAKY